MSRIVVELTHAWIAKLRSRRPAFNYGSLEEAAQERFAHLGPPALPQLLDIFGKYSPANPDLPRDLDPRTRSRPLFPPAIANGPAVHNGPRPVVRRGTPRDPFEGFFAIDTSDLTSTQIGDLLRALRSHDDVIASAVIESRLANESDTGAVKENASAPQQHFLKAIGADGDPVDDGDWDGIGFAELDEGWILDHEAIAHVNGTPTYPNGLNFPSDHGTGVLGIMVGRGAITGVARGAVAKALISNAPERSIAESIREFLYNPRTDTLAFGDVLLIELEHADDEPKGLPFEIHREAFVAVSYAVSAGIVVVEVAGNGDFYRPWDLDNVAPEIAPAWSARWREDLEEIPDSGAILVSGTKGLRDPALLPERYEAHPDLNYGRRVNCYGWGDDIDTCLGRDRYGVFRKTSGASAIIAGLVLRIQQLAKQRLGRPLPPLQMRALLQHEACGVPVWKNTGRVGYLPRLNDIDALLDQLPSLRIRAYKGDDETQRNPAAMRSESPDIVLSDSDTLGADGEPTAALPARYAWIRASNEGKAAAQVRACVFWSSAGDGDSPVWHAVALGHRREVPPDGRRHWLAPVALDLKGASGQVEILAATDCELEPRPMIPPVRFGRSAEVDRGDMLDFVEVHLNTAMRTFGPEKR